jgi:hypothetical protein
LKHIYHNLENNMKKGLLSLACVLALLVATSTTTQAQSKLGAGLVFGTEAESIGLQANFYTPIASVENLSVGGDLTYFLPKEIVNNVDRTWFEINVNGQYQFYSEQMLSAYALAGINITTYGVKYDGPGSDVWRDGSDTAAGLNLGVGGEYAVNPSLFAFAEFKFVISDYDQAVFTAGLRFPIGGK